MKKKAISQGLMVAPVESAFDVVVELIRVAP